MRISKATLETLQALAALPLDEHESQRMRAHLDLMGRWLDDLPPVGQSPQGNDAAGYDDASTSPVGLPRTDASLRDDHVEDSLPVEKALQNAPDMWDGHYRVPPFHDRER